jgi:hypothetical protein
MKHFLDSEHMWAKIPLFFLTMLYSTYVLLLQDTEKYVIYNVNKEEYDTCRIMSNNPRIVAYCTEPYIER